MPPTLEPKGFFRRIPLAPHEMRDRVTPTADMIVLCHLGVPRLDASTHTLRIDGLVHRPMTLTLADLGALERVEVTAVHQCAGSPLQPDVPTRRVCNVRWRGVRLADALALAGIKAQARYLWASGADYGTFADATVDSYVKDLPLEAVRPDVLLATHVNDQPLPPENGYPLRLVVPGFFGTNSVKWLTRIEARETRADSPFTTRWYNDPVLDIAGHPTGATRPVWHLAPEAVIVTPAPGAAVAAGVPLLVEGWAWGGGGIAKVEVSSDGGAAWQAAAIEPRTDKSWQKFTATVTPLGEGPLTLRARATGLDGAMQPEHGARNACHGVEITVANRS